MIEINLLPANLRTKRKKKEARVREVKSFALPKKFLFMFTLGPIALLVLVHLLLISVIVLRSNQLDGLKKQWPKFESDKIKLDALRKDIGGLEENVKSVEGLITKRIDWSKKLDSVNARMPKGMWLTYISVNSNQFVVQGSAVSKKSEEMTLIGKFLHDLKSNPELAKNIKNLEIGPAQRRWIKGWEVVDFIFTGSVKN